ncbi:hypothetical protein NLJ89_g9380 [Agrocybe chaxingu]|uniref:Uncharacterized protein n=1 Tax=Agrocybe chaxingu TaxID=84603 RepID=A0A9W8JQX3_9AGAR|nr:hypothetical protein NLJ89_g9380 [Agrocybe chaxingu]
MIGASHDRILTSLSQLRTTVYILRHPPAPPPLPNQAQQLQEWRTSAEFQMADVRTQNNGFVKTVVEAYNGHHHHLVIKPDDIWISILSQLSVLNIHVNAKSKELRSLFVKHQGKKTLRVYMPGNQRIVDFGSLSVQKTDEIQKKCRSKNSDPEPERWATLLRPVLRWFVDVFTRAESGLEPDVDFWNQIANRYLFGSGASFLSGWITAFCVWDSTTEKWQGSPRSSVPQTRLGSTPKSHAQLVLEEATYPVIDTHKVPMGYCEVDVKVRDAEGEVDCVMVAGHMASLVRGESKDTLAPLASWFMYVRPEEVESDTALLDEVSRKGKSSSEMVVKANEPSWKAKLRKILCSA